MDSDGPTRRADLNAVAAALTQEMEKAATALDFERARLLRDQLNLLRGGASLGDALAADTRGLERQQPGRMGLGTSQQRTTPPKPDPMTRSSGTRKSRKDRP